MGRCAARTTHGDGGCDVTMATYLMKNPNILSCACAV